MERLDMCLCRGNRDENLEENLWRSHRKRRRGLTRMFIQRYGRTEHGFISFFPIPNVTTCSCHDIKFFNLISITLSVCLYIRPHDHLDSTPPTEFFVLVGQSRTKTMSIDRWIIISSSVKISQVWSLVLFFF